MAPIIFRILKNNKYIICLSLLLYGCKDFIATDLRDKNMSVLAPADSLSTTSATINFYWEELDGALTYHLQIAKPSFDAITVIVADTTLTGTQYTKVLTPGNYQWRICAKNGSTQTPYVVRSFTIDSTSDLSTQTLILFSPTNEYATNDSSVSFNWYGLYNATQYRLLLKSHATGFSGTQVLPDQVITDTTLTLSSLSEGYYDWGVRAESGISNTSYVVRSVYVDYTNPGAVSPGNPVNNAIITGPSITFSWSNTTDTGSPLYDSLYVYTDTAMNTIRKAISINGTSLNDTLAIGVYYWRIKAYDKAGNQGNFSVLRKFTVN